MLPYRVTILSNTDKVIAAQNKQVRSSPKLMNTAMTRNVNRLKSRMLKELRVEPPKPPAGITRLMTPRQRRAFWASDGFGHGIPYTRTHRLVKAWKVTTKTGESGGVVTVENDNPAAEFVYGVRRQRFLVAVGWLDPDPIVSRYQKELELVVAETWHTVSDFDAGISR